MKKAKLTLGIALSALSCSLLAGCGGASYSPEGVILTYTDSTGKKTNYTADDLFSDYYKDTSKVSTMFDSIFKVIVRNYFNENQDGHDKYAQILKNATVEVEGIKSKAKENANTNSTGYDEEWNKLLDSYSCKDEDELLEHFIYEGELSEFNDQFYDKNISVLRDGLPSDENGYDGYINSKLPYHVRHILVKISDSASTNYYNATISGENAIKLADVAETLASGNSFGDVALKYSDDSSNTKFGDLGIMDKDTSFVNEFKLGVYAYENLYNTATKEAAKTSNISMDKNDIATNYKEVAEDEGNIASIPYGVFAQLRADANVVKDADGHVVNDDSANTYPRNIWFNNYLNKHQIAVIKYSLGETTASTLSETAPSTFKYVEGLSKDTTESEKVLCTTDGQPILVVRAGTSDYQGIHFIVVQRSPLIETDENGTTISEYWTTKYPGQSEYPTKDGVNKKTYVNFLNQEIKEYKSRAEEVESKIKSFDSDLNKYIYSKYVASEKIKVQDETLKEAINDWINRSKVKKGFDNDISWEKTWEEYIEVLKAQNSQEDLIFPAACAIGFKDHTVGTEAADWERGGKCYDKK